MKSYTGVSATSLKMVSQMCRASGSHPSATVPRKGKNRTCLNFLNSWAWEALAYSLHCQILTAAPWTQYKVGNRDSTEEMICHSQVHGQ